jgi:hypothetical protein
VKMLNLIRREFTVDVPLSTAWQHLARVEDWPTWASHINRIELTPGGELTPHTLGIFHLATGLRSDFKMSELNQHRNWKWVGPFLWLMVHYDHQFEAMGEQRTRLIWTVGADGCGAAIWGRLFAAIYNRNLDKAIPRLITEMNALVSRPTPVHKVRWNS